MKELLASLLVCGLVALHALCPPSAQAAGGPDRQARILMGDTLMTLWSLGMTESHAMSQEELSRAALYFVLAGPGANLLCALALAAGGETVPAGAHLTLCLFNLLPVRPLDGGRALYLAVSWLAGPRAGERAARWVGTMTGALLGTALVWVMGRSGGSLWLLPPAVAALYLAVGEGISGNFLEKSACNLG